jgi:hypothetical protein
MILRRGSVLGILLFTFIVGVLPVQAQNAAQGVPARVAALQAQVDQALATIAQLQAALASQAGARQGGTVTPSQLQAAIEAQSLAWSTQLGEAMASQGSTWSAKLDAAVAVEAAARAAADTGLRGEIATEAAAREASVGPLLTLVPLSQYVSVSTGSINGLAGPHVIFSGANVHVRSGDSSRNSFTRNGLGNLVVGYNEPSGEPDAERSGSHNLVVGPNHRYNFGVGFVTGFASRLGGDAASVSGGAFNNAGAEFSSVSAGSNNWATGMYSSVSGGNGNTASGNTAAISAGGGNQATGDLSSVAGGANNTASGLFSTVGGGSGLTNAGSFTFIP